MTKQGMFGLLAGLAVFALGVAGKVIVNPPERKVTTPMRVGRPVILNLCIHRFPPSAL